MNKPVSVLIRHLALAAGLPLAFATAIVARGQTVAPAEPPPPPPGGDATVVLPAFGTTANMVDPYHAADQMSASRSAEKIIDTPMTVNVITPALMQDVGPDTIFSVANYFAGVSPGRGSGSGGINDRMTFRGFESFSRTFDNFSGYLFPQTTASDGNIDPVFVEHAELVMGPDAILAPTGSPGGSINLVTKSPLFVQGTDLTAEVGRFDANKYTLDSTGPIGDGKHMAYRVIAAYQDAKTYLPGSDRIMSASAQFTYKFTDTSKITFKYFGEDADYKGTAGQSNLDGEEIYTPDTVGGATLSDTPQPGFSYNGWNGDATWSHREVRDNTLEAELTSALSERVNMRLAAQLYYDNQDNRQAYPSSTIPETWNPVTGQETSVGAVNPLALTEVATWEHYESRQIQVQNDFAGNFEVGSVSLKPVVGWAYQQGTNPVYYTLQDKNMPAANLAAGYYNPPAPDASQYTSVSGITPMIGAQEQAYGFLRAGFFKERLFLTGGASRTWAQVNDYSIGGMTLADGTFVGSTRATTDSTLGHTGSAIEPSVKGYHDTYQAGALFKILPNLSAYYSFSSNAQIAQGTPLWEAGKQHEFGLKADLFDHRLSITADHFQITESNLSFTNPLFNTGQSTVPLIFADETSHGYELNIVGGITSDLSVIASYTNQHLRDSFGRRLRNIPDNMANLLLDYHFHHGFLNKADVFVGIIHQGNTAGETVSGFTPLGVPEQPGFYVAKYTVVNAGAGYHWDRYGLHLNVDNALNQQFWWQASSRTSLAPYPGLDLRLTFTVHL